MMGYSEMPYLDGVTLIGLARDDGYTPILDNGREAVMVPTTKLGDLMLALAYAIGLEEAESMIRGAQR